MSVKQIIQESISKNPIGLKEALAEELRSRVAFAIEAKMNEEIEEELDEEDDNLDESASRYGVDTGPLMIGNAWIKPAKLSSMIEQLRSEGEYKNFAIGRLTKPSGKSSQVAISIGNSKPDYYFEKGIGKHHTFYYDTGRGHRQTSDSIVITGMITVGKEGDPKVQGKANMNEKTTLMVFK
jgi:hypothetical protein